MSRQGQASCAADPCYRQGYVEVRVRDGSGRFELSADMEMPHYATLPAI